MGRVTIQLLGIVVSFDHQPLMVKMWKVFILVFPFTTHYTAATECADWSGIKTSVSTSRK